MEALETPDPEPKKPVATEGARKSGKGLGSRLVVILVTLATIIGGVAAGFQIYDYVRSKPDPEAPKDPSAWQTLQLDPGLSVKVPPNWDKVDREAMDALTRVYTGIEGQLPKGERDRFLFIKERLDDPEAPGALGMVGLVDVDSQTTVEAIADTFRRRANTQSCTILQTAHGPTMRAIVYQDRELPDGSMATFAMDTYICIRNRRAIMGYFYAEPRKHLETADTFRQIYESLATS